MRLSRLAPVFLPFALAATVGCNEVVNQKGSGGSTTAGTGGATSATTADVTTGAGGTGGSGGAVDNGKVSTTYPAFHPNGPVAATAGGPTLGAPKLVPVFFHNEDPTMRTALEDFVSKIGATNYWSAIATEYNVGTATSLAPVELVEDAPATIDDMGIQTWLAGKLNTGDTAFPAADPNTIYVLHYPAGSTITLGMGAQNTSCTGFGGYHSDTKLDAAHSNQLIAYAVVPRCPTFGQLSGLDAVTGAESHELIEASTDPFPMDDPAYVQVDDAHVYWERILGGGEVGDMCEEVPNIFTKFPELDYTVQRTWSNKAAKAGHDPCVPNIAGQPYFNAAAELNQNVSASLFGQTITVKGVQIAVGETKDVTLDLFSDASTNGPWQVDIQELNQTPHLDMSLDRTSGQNGEKLHASITVTAQGKNKTETFVVTSTLGQKTNLWVGIVGTP